MRWELFLAILGIIISSIALLIAFRKRIHSKLFQIKLRRYQRRTPFPIILDYTKPTESERRLDAWHSISDWKPRHKDNSLHLEGNEYLRDGLAFLQKSSQPKALILKEFSAFRTGVIECEFMLRDGALFNIVVQGMLPEDYYFVRFDPRSDYGDCVVYKPVKKDPWMPLKAPSTLSMEDVWIKARIVINKYRITLSLGDDNQLRETQWVNTPKLRRTQITLFAEYGEVSIRSFKVAQSYYEALRK